MPYRIVIIGGGTGGSIVASRLAIDGRDLVDSGRLDITVITPTDDHLYQPGLLYVAFGRMDPGSLHRRESLLLPRGVRLRLGTVDRIDWDQRAVHLQGGDSVPYDAVVIATGAVPDFDSVPGLSSADTFYTEAGAMRLAERLRAFNGGRIVLTVGVPHKCPVAPLEFTFMLDTWLRERGLRDRTELVYTYPIGRVHSLEAVAEWADPVLRERGVTIETFFNVESVEPDRQIVHSIEGVDLAYDWLITIPPHRGAQFLRAPDAPGAGAGWVPTDPHTLGVKGYEGAWALGDTTDLPISKAGSTAHYQAEVLSANLLALAREAWPAHTYSGKVYCFLETGNDEATYITFDYTTPPKPVPPSRLLHWFKLAFNRTYWLMPEGVL